MTKYNPLGNIEITSRAIAAIAGQAALRSYGVVGMAARTSMNRLAYRLTRNPRHGVEVNIARGSGNEADAVVTIDLYLIIEYGTRLAVVAQSAAAAARFEVEQALGLPVSAVNVHVQGLRISAPVA